MHGKDLDGWGLGGWELKCVLDRKIFRLALRFFLLFPKKFKTHLYDSSPHLFFGLFFWYPLPNMMAEVSFYSFSILLAGEGKKMRRPQRVDLVEGTRLVGQGMTFEWLIVCAGVKDLM